jgi:hypothetical protein
MEPELLDVAAVLVQYSALKHGCPSSAMWANTPVPSPKLSMEQPLGPSTDQFPPGAFAPAATSRFRPACRHLNAPPEILQGFDLFFEPLWIQTAGRA